MVRFIRGHLGVNLPISFGRVNSGGPEDAPAWIRLPTPMPLYGSEAYKRLKPTLFMRKNFLEESQFPQVAIAIAHEMCHVLLDSVGHSLHREEEAVDLTAMIRGYGQLYAEAAGIGERQRRQLGYLSPDEVRYALRAIAAPPRSRSTARNLPPTVDAATLWRAVLIGMAIGFSGVGGFWIGLTVHRSPPPLDFSAWSSPVPPAMANSAPLCPMPAIVAY
jgi:hypothetical protein